MGVALDPAAMIFGQTGGGVLAVERRVRQQLRQLGVHACLRAPGGSVSASSLRAWCCSPQAGGVVPMNPGGCSRSTSALPVQDFSRLINSVLYSPIADSIKALERIRCWKSLVWPGRLALLTLDAPLL
jgi:hypothetical protein